MSGANVRCAIAEPSVSGAVRCQLRLEPSGSSAGRGTRGAPGARDRAGARTAPRRARAERRGPAAPAAAQPAGARALREVRFHARFLRFTAPRVHIRRRGRHRQYIYCCNAELIFPPQFALLSTPGRSVPAASAADAVGRYPDSCERGRRKRSLPTLCSGSRQWPGMHRRSCRPVARGQRRHVSNAISNTACESSDRSRQPRGGQPLGARRPLQACWASPP